LPIAEQIGGIQLENEWIERSCTLGVC
jgi:hypothetical protein